jgi:porphobilinogen synthase
MVKFGAQHGLFDEKELVIENLTSIVRAGADMILTYHTADAARKKWLN